MKLFPDLNPRRSHKRIKTDNPNSEFYPTPQLNSKPNYSNQNYQDERTSTGQGHGIDTVAATLQRALKLDTAMILLQQPQVIQPFYTNQSSA